MRQAVGWLPNRYQDAAAVQQFLRVALCRDLLAAARSGVSRGSEEGSFIATRNIDEPPEQVQRVFDSLNRHRQTIRPY